MGGGSNSGKPGASEALSLVFRIATVGLSLASAIMTGASTQSQCVHDNCSGEAAANVSSGDYKSFKYSAVADLLSAVLQVVALYLEVVRKDKAAKTVEFIDKLLLALTSTSAALLLAVDDITSCGTPRGGGRRRRGRFCSQAGRFCGQIRASSALSLVAAVSVSVTVYTRHIPVSVKLTPRTSSSAAGIPMKGHTTAPPPIVTPKPPTSPTGTADASPEKKGPCTEIVMPPPNCGCPTLTIRQGCESPERAMSPPCCGCPRRAIPQGCESPERAMSPPCCGCPRRAIPQGCDNPERAMSPPCCGCPRRAIPQGCDNPEPCGALCVYVSG